MYCNCFIICGLSLFKADITPERTVTSLAQPLLAQVGLSVANQNQLEAGFVRYRPETQQAESVTRRKKRSVWRERERKKSPNSKARRYRGGGCNEDMRAVRWLLCETGSGSSEM